MTEENINNQQIEEYIKRLWQPIILTLVFQIAALFTQNQDTLIVVADVFLIIYIIVRLNLKDKNLSSWINGVVVFFLAFIVAIIKALVNFKFYYLFNIMTEPIIYAAGAALLANAIVLIKNNLTNKKKEA